MLDGLCGKLNWDEGPSDPLGLDTADPGRPSLPGVDRVDKFDWEAAMDGRPVDAVWPDGGFVRFVERFMISFP
jgi:hypothetical protein